MRRISNINIGESIRRGRLIYQESFFDKWSYFFVILYFSMLFAITLYMNYFLFTIDNLDLFFNFIFLPTLSFLGIYIAFRKATEKRLIRISYYLEKEAAQQLVTKYLKSKKYHLVAKTADCMIFSKPTDFMEIISFTQYKTLVVLFDKEVIHFVLLTKGHRLNLPVLISHLIIRRDLKKLFITAEQ